MQKPKGTYDVFGDYGKKVQYLENLFKEIMYTYNYEYVRTPIFEASELFKRGVGETTDIVSKETYDFLDRGNRWMTLRPEGTAGVVRSFVENKMYARDTKPVKAWYLGPMFRYERPQSGRFREFYQFGVEVFGSDSPMIDAEVISIPVTIYRALGLKNIKVNINSLGDSESREKYREALINFFEPHLDELCEDCRSRFNKNPLRILDCKVDNGLDIMKNAPRMLEYLNDESKKHFDDVLMYLNNMGIDYVVDANIVRGLDYYTHTVFEVTAEIKDFGSQNVLCGGGRYNNLVSNIGGVNTPGVGFALGMERLINALDAEKIDLDLDTPLDVYIIPMSEKEKCNGMELLMALRSFGIRTDIDYMNRNLKSNFKQADRYNTNFIIIIGEDEVENNYLTVRNNNTKEEIKVKNVEVIDYLFEKLDECCDCGDECECHKGGNYENTCK